MGVKFFCKKQGECIIPLGISNAELERRRLPHSCLECEYYVTKLPNNETCCFFDWQKNNTSE